MVCLFRNFCCAAIVISIFLSHGLLANRKVFLVLAWSFFLSNFFLPPLLCSFFSVTVICSSLFHQRNLMYLLWDLCRSFHSLVLRCLFSFFVFFWDLSCVDMYSLALSLSFSLSFICFARLCLQSGNKWFLFCFVLFFPHGYYICRWLSFIHDIGAIITMWTDINLSSFSMKSRNIYNIPLLLVPMLSYLSWYMLSSTSYLLVVIFSAKGNWIFYTKLMEILLLLLLLLLVYIYY